MFRYGSFRTDPDGGLLICRYWLDGREFAERVTLSPGPRWRTEAARAAARLVFLLAGVSYYKTAAPPVIELGDTAVTEAELAFLREFYLQGLGEFAYRNALDLSSLRIEGRSAGHGGDAASPGGRPPGIPPILGENLPPRPPRPPDPPWAGGPWCRSAAGSTRSSWWSGCGGSPTPRCSS